MVSVCVDVTLELLDNWSVCFRIRCTSDMISKRCDGPTDAKRSFLHSSVYCRTTLNYRSLKSSEHRSFYQHDKLFEKIEEILKLKPFAYKQNYYYDAYPTLYHTTFVLGKFTLSQWSQIAKRGQDTKNGFFVRGILIVRYFDVDDSFGYSDNVPMEKPQKVLLFVSAKWSQMKDRRLHLSRSFHVRKYDVKEQNAKYITSTKVN